MHILWCIAFPSTLEALLAKERKRFCSPSGFACQFPMAFELGWNICWSVLNWKHIKLKLDKFTIIQSRASYKQSPVSNKSKEKSFFAKLSFRSCSRPRNRKVGVQTMNSGIGNFMWKLVRDWTLLMHSVHLLYKEYEVLEGFLVEECFLYNWFLIKWFAIN